MFPVVRGRYLELIAGRSGLDELLTLSPFHHAGIGVGTSHWFGTPLPLSPPPVVAVDQVHEPKSSAVFDLASNSCLTPLTK